MANTKITSANLDTLTTLTVDDITIDGSTISDSDNLTLDVGANIILDADGGEIQLKDGGTEFGQLVKSGNDFRINQAIQDGDIVFRGNDGGSIITALTIDMSDGGKATFNSDIVFGGTGTITSATNSLKALNTGDNGFLIRSAVSSAANPSYSNVDDTNTGMFLPGSDVIGLTTGGSERWRIDSSGHFTGASGSKIVQTIASGGGNFLEVTHTGNEAWSLAVQSGTGADDYLDIGINGGTRAISIHEDGKIGIGTSTPTAPLHIKTSIDDAYSLRIEGATNNSANYHGIGFAGESSNTKAAILFKDIAQSYARGDMLFCLNNDADQTSATDSDAVMTLKNNGSMLLHGGETSGIQEIFFNNGGLTINYQSQYTLSGILNTGALIAIGQQRSQQGVTYDHCLIFAELGTDATILANPSGRFAINSNNTSNKTNIYVSGNSVVIMNEVGTNHPYTIAVFRF